MCIRDRVYDVLEAMQQDTGIRLSTLKVDGGASANNFLMQFQADLIGGQVQRPMIRETTALGAAYLAGLAVGMWNSVEEIKRGWILDRMYEPQMPAGEQEHLVAMWHKACLLYTSRCV